MTGRPFFDWDFELDVGGPGWSTLRARLRTDARRVAVYGPSGAGKTSLLEALLGWRRPGRGWIRVGGRTLRDADRGVDVAVERRRIGVLTQDLLLFPHLTVAGNLRSGLRGRGGDGEELLHRVVGLLEVEPLLDRDVATLSGGERHRVALGRALAAAPDLLVLDEPLASLDPSLRTRVLSDLVQVVDELDLPLVLVSHDQVDGQVLCSHAQVLEAGEVVAEGPPSEMYRRVAGSDGPGVDNVLWGRTMAAPAEETRRDDVGDGTWPLQLDGGAVVRVPGDPVRAGRVAVGLRADEIVLAMETPTPTSANNVLEGVARSVTELGPTCVVRIELTGAGAVQSSGAPEEASPGHGSVAGTEIDVEITPRARRRLGVEPGCRVVLLFKSRSLRLLANPRGPGDGSAAGLRDRPGAASVARAGDSGA